MSGPVDSAGTPGERGLRVSIGLCAAVLIVTALYFSGSIFAPLAFALLIIAIIWPVQKRLQARLPKLVALAVSMLATVVVLAAFVLLVAWGFGRVGRFIVSDAARFQLLYGNMAEWLEGHGIVLAGLWAEHFNVGWLIRLFQQITTRLNSHAQLLPRGADLRDPRPARGRRCRRQAARAGNRRIRQGSARQAGPKPLPNSAATCWCGP